MIYALKHFGKLCAQITPESVIVKFQEAECTRNKAIYIPKLRENFVEEKQRGKNKQKPKAESRGDEGAMPLVRKRQYSTID